MLKFEPCQLLTLKNDPGSHFYHWKMTRGVIFQRGHYLMLHWRNGMIKSPDNTKQGPMKIKINDVTKPSMTQLLQTDLERSVAMTGVT